MRALPRHGSRSVCVPRPLQVDGIDVGVFEFEPVHRSAADPRALVGALQYTTLANKTFAYTAEERQWVLGLRAMDRKVRPAPAGSACSSFSSSFAQHAVCPQDGNDYAIANYRFGEWFAERVLQLLQESGIPKESVHLIGSHGQTVSGHPHWEFGDVNVIAQRTGITTAADFRPAGELGW